MASLGAVQGVKRPLGEGVDGTPQTRFGLTDHSAGYPKVNNSAKPGSSRVAWHGHEILARLAPPVGYTDVPACGSAGFPVTSTASFLPSKSKSDCERHRPGLHFNRGGHDLSKFMRGTKF